MALYSYAKINGKYGVYRSNDAGATWIRINDDNNQFGAANRTITGNPRVYGRVYVGTNGLGIVIGEKVPLEKVQTVLTGPDAAQKGKKAEIDYSVQSLKSIASRLLTFKYDNHIFDFEKIKSKDSTVKIVAVQHDKEAGTVTVSLESKGAGKKPSDNQNVLRLTFKAIEKGTGSIELTQGLLVTGDGVQLEAVASVKTIQVEDK